MNYLDGNEAMVGDAVTIEYGRTPATVVAVVEADRLAEFNVSEPGLMLESAPFGLVYIPASMFDDQGLSFKSRGLKSNMRWSGP
jgi:hypothetical protein